MKKSRLKGFPWTQIFRMGEYFAIQLERPGIFKNLLASPICAAIIDKNEADNEARFIVTPEFLKGRK